MGTTPGTAPPKEARAHIAQQSWIVAQIGPSKVGKTTDMLYTANEHGFYIGRPGSMRGCLRILGWAPPLDRIEDAQDLEAIHEALKRRFETGGKIDQKKVVALRGVTTICIDDFGLAAERSKLKLEGRLSGWDLWGALGRLIQNIITFCSDLGYNVILGGHPKPPLKGEMGGMKLPTAELTASLPKHCDIVLLVGQDVMRAPHPYSYLCGPIGAPNWTTGDRNHVCPPNAPLNLAELLRLGDRELGMEFRVPRLAVMEAPGWSSMGSAEALISRISGKLVMMDASAEAEALTRVGRKLISEKIPPHQIVWAIRDIRDRVELMRSNENRLLNDFGLDFFGTT